MSYFIIFVILAIVVGPVMWLMPSAKQKQQMALREYALKQGLQIKICDLPQSRRKQVRKEAAIKGVVYRLPLVTNKPLTMTSVYLLKKTEEGTEWQGEPPKGLQEHFEIALKQCPSSAVGVELSTAGVACYWSEVGGDNAVDQIKSVLSSFREQLQGKNLS